MRAPLAAAIATLISASAAASPAPHRDDPAEHAKRVAEALRDAIDARKPVAIASHLQAPLRYRGLAFAEGCAGPFGDHGTVPRARLRTFAACLLSVPQVRNALFVAGVVGVDGTDAPRKAPMYAGISQLDVGV